MSAPPDLEPFPANVDDWAQYLERLYDLYLDTIIRSSPELGGLPVKARFQPAYDGKGFSFWHVISEGEREEDRTPDPRRCERVAWIRWAIDCANNGDDCVRCFKSRRTTRKGPRTNLVIWAHEVDFAVVLEIRGDKYILVSAYQVKEHRRVAFQAEWKRQTQE
jgi:hypothetical protein